TSDVEFQYFESIFQSNVNILDYCIDRGINTNIVDDDGLTGLHHAAIRGSVPMMTVLLASRRTEINKTDPQKLTALMYACMYRNWECVKYLLQKGANPNLVNDKLQTALHMACVQNSVRCAFELIHKGAKLNVRDAFDNSPLSIAVTNTASMTMSKYLLRKGASATSTKQFPLFLECVLNCTDPNRLRIIQLLLDNDVDIYCLHPISKRNCLHYVAITGYLPAALYLTRLGEANLDVGDLTNRTPQDIAWDHHNWEVYNYFMRRIKSRWARDIVERDILADVYNSVDSKRHVQFNK
ncbi:hypothetical protein NQ315_001019, partial [Exocentrus adspersus]